MINFLNYLMQHFLKAVQSELLQFYEGAKVFLQTSYESGFTNCETRLASALITVP